MVASHSTSSSVTVVFLVGGLVMKIRHPSWESNGTTPKCHYPQAIAGLLRGFFSRSITTTFTRPAISWRTQGIGNLRFPSFVESTRSSHCDLKIIFSRSSHPPTLHLQPSIFVNFVTTSQHLFFSPSVFVIFFWGGGEIHAASILSLHEWSQVPGTMPPSGKSRSKVAW